MIQSRDNAHCSTVMAPSPHTHTPLAAPHPPANVTVCLIVRTIIKCYRLCLSIKSTSVLLCVEVAVSVLNSVQHQRYMSLLI
jgi:hypothetical protein